MKFLIAGSVAVFVGLFAYCLKKLKTKREIKERIIALLAVAGCYLLLLILIASISGTSDDWIFVLLAFTLYWIAFGWRLIVDLKKLKKNSNTIKPVVQTVNRINILNPAKKRSFTNSIEYQSNIKNDFYKNNKISYKTPQETLCKDQKQKDNELICQKNSLSQHVLSACENIISIWEADIYLDKNNKNARFRSEIYLNCLTPKLFLDNYYLFKKGIHDDIKDSIYKERPYLVLETLINMGLYIFQTKNNLYILQYIINSATNDSLSIKNSAKKILIQETTQHSINSL